MSHAPAGLEPPFLFADEFSGCEIGRGFGFLSSTLGVPGAGRGALRRFLCTLSGGEGPSGEMAPSADGGSFLLALAVTCLPDTSVACLGRGRFSAYHRFAGLQLELRRLPPLRLWAFFTAPRRVFKACGARGVRPAHATSDLGAQA